MKQITSIFIIFLATFFIACNDFLDTPPDKRAELDTDEKVAEMLVSAYPTLLPTMMFEMMSDNVTDNGPQNTDRYNELAVSQSYRYANVTEPDWDSPKMVWELCYKAISSANEALEAIENMGNKASQNGSKAEALLCRAFGHFVLVSAFSKAYNPVSSDTDMGIPYVEAPETTVSPVYERGTVASVYEKINRDIEEALPLHQDKFSKPSYHFNRKAAYAFAARFNLFYGKWDKAAQYASVALGDNPRTMFRDYYALSLLPEPDDINNAYCNSDYACNFLIIPQVETLWGRTYQTNYRHGHNSSKVDATLAQYFPWGGTVNGVLSNIYELTGANGTNYFYPKIMEFFEMTDPTADVGVPHTVVVPFTVEETLACRAEAYAMQGDFGNAVKDLNIFYAAWDVNHRQFTTEQISAYYSVARTYSPYVAMESRFNIQQGTQENLVRAVLAVRRFENVHTGQRWLDIKRHGITVTHPQMLSQTVADEPIIVRPYDDLTAIQLPAEVISAGLPANPR
ncbi:MAG: RagB/SusD family nutrient uptake outer membrane protein [Bacteroidales bacterium]|jgi:hypothetical protein|nr:RagB/SusD family nutrient uptake outer membrane protein [Bacteroidales bacterium]